MAISSFFSLCKSRERERQIHPPAATAARITTLGIPARAGAFFSFRQIYSAGALFPPGAFGVSFWKAGLSVRSFPALSPRPVSPWPSRYGLFLLGFLDFRPFREGNRFLYRQFMFAHPLYLHLFQFLVPYFSPFSGTVSFRWRPISKSSYNFLNLYLPRSAPVFPLANGLSPDAFSA